MRSLLLPYLIFLVAACGSSSTATGGGQDSGPHGDAGSKHDAGPGHDGGGTMPDAGRDGVAPPSDGAAHEASVRHDGGGTDAHEGTDAHVVRVDAGSCGSCPSGYTCGTANSLPVCRAPSGIPLFSNVYVILMENTSLSTLTPAMTGGTAPNLEKLATTYATGDDYHGIAHPSLPNYIALTSGATQGVACDCSPLLDAGTCNFINCNLLLGGCSGANTAVNLGDQLEAAGLTWMDFGEDMNTPCNLTDNGNYAVRHNPFLYYEQIQTTPRCDAHVVDFTNFNPATPPSFTYIAPNLIDDMHNPDPTNSTNIPDGDMWIGPHVDTLLASAGYKNGGLIVIVWDEDDGSGGITGTDDPIPIFVMSPYAKSAGYVSHTMANHYALLATFEDGLGVGRLGMAVGAAPLVDYFPAN